jgi:two-component system, NtrC family, response regulator AlgB
MDEAIQMGRRVLLVDDDSGLLRNFRWTLEDAGFQCVTANSTTLARERLSDGVFDCCFLDLHIGEDYGLDLLPTLRAQAPWMRVVIVTSVGDLAVAVSAMQKGASDYLQKPCAPEQLVAVAERMAEARALELKIDALEKQRDAGGEVQLSSKQPDMAKVFELARSVADTDATVLILGESGTGKGVIARAVHDWSPRKPAPFATVNCPSLTAELLESELFGHAKGAFTGAVEQRKGRVQAADGGTLFLDEIGDFPIALQPKLLRFIQDREYERVGDPTTRTANVRLVAATNRNLEQMIRDGSFREDLYYRLNVITMTLPPLRERPDDIESLAQRFLERFALNYRRPARRFDADALAALKAYRWPGNIRELRNAVERIAILATSELIGVEALPATVSGFQGAAGARVGASVSLEALERAHISAILASSESLDAASKTLGIDASTLYRKRKQYGL